MGIDFREIPVTWRVPGTFVEFDWTAANQGLVLDMQRLLIFAQKLSTGTGATNTPLDLLSSDQGVQLGGRGSMAARMARAAKKNNTVTDCKIILLDEPAAGVKAAGSVTFGGAGTGTIPLVIDGRLVQVATASTDNAAAMATAAAAAINADLDLPVTAAIDGFDTAKVNLTCRWKGETGNQIDLRVGYWRGLKAPAGVTVTVAAMSGGTGVPSLTAALDALTDIQWHHVVFPFTDSVSIAAIAAEMEDRWNGLRQKEGQIWTALTGTHGQLTTFGAGVNSGTGSTIGVGKSPTAAYAIAAAYGAACAYRLGIDPSRQLRSVVLDDVLPPEEADRFTDQERNLLLYKGIATTVETIDGKVLIERAITWRQVNDFGLPDPSRLDVTTVAVASAMRQTARNYVSTRFPDFKLADDGTRWSPGQAVLTPSLFKGHVIALARLWEEEGWVESVDAWKDGIVVTRPKEVDPNRLDILLPPDIINNAMVFAFLIQPRV